MTCQVSGEELGHSISKEFESTRKPETIKRFLEQKHGLTTSDATQIALRLANEPRRDDLQLINHLELVLTQQCNLRCDYCFVSDRPERMLTRELGEQAINFLLKTSGDLETVTITFFGGEPLLALNLLRQLVCYGEKAALKVAKKIQWRMTTNGTLLDGESLTFFKEHQVIYLLSLDGDKNTQDRHRKTISSKSSFEIIDNKLTLMKQYQPWIGARVTLMPDTVDSLADNIRFLVRRGIQQFIIEPAEGVEWPEVVWNTYEEQMVEVARYYYDHKETQNLRINFLDDLANNDPVPNRNVRGCWAGKTSVAVAPDGSLYPCSKFINSLSKYPPFLLGHVSYGLREHKERNPVNQVPIRNECYECEFVFECTGGCPANNYLATGTQARVSPDECRRVKMKQRVKRAVLLHLMKEQQLQ